MFDIRLSNKQVSWLDYFYFFWKVHWFKRVCMKTAQYIQIPLPSGTLFWSKIDHCAFTCNTRWPEFVLVVKLFEKFVCYRTILQIQAIAMTATIDPAKILRLDWLASYQTPSQKRVQEVNWFGACYKLERSCKNNKIGQVFVKNNKVL